MSQTNPLLALKFTTKPKADVVEPTTVRRNKLIQRLNEQRAMITCLLENEVFTAYKEVLVLDEQSGEKRKVKRPKRIRAWFYQSADKYYFEIKYGTKSLELQKNKPAIEVGSKDNLLTTINTIIDAVKNGFLDAQLLQVKGPRKG
jgi:hypothetical protein